ncbi:MAG TPA: SDR family NAD(P)-dependent oxidoreductase [Rubrivivax sp.]|nr:SDR family NAD(P)-dependent oxidoreductase [Rubrivivax sp.]
MERIAMVTGANQGLGLALVRGLARRLAAQDLVYLTARDPARGEAALDQLGATAARVRFEQLDVTGEDSISRFAAMLLERHGGVDLVASNAAARIVKERPQAEQVRDFVRTNNHGCRQLLGQLLPLLKAGARCVIVASSFGRLSNLAPPLRPLFDTDHRSLDDIERVMDAYVEAVERGEAAARGWPEWINVASKVGQVAAARIAARLVSASRPGDGILVNAVCPGLIDTGASRPWFDDMSRAQSPDEAARAVIDLLLTPPGAAGAPHGQLMRFGAALPWVDD